MDAPPPDVVLDSAVQAKLLARWLLVAVVLFVVVLVGSFVLVRGMRRQREIMFKPDATPTDSTDLWRRHRLPEGSDAAPPDESA